ncbi:putative MATE family efflux protein [Kushneria sinocarnis]|uniref:Putative MATE family efflux protein n=1 Tax=Kushneria sinocarnis TaxID=595502 RepID=A0A420X081_9GAMM|nr:MATE family efflux transporter [Kushneria sinocarnis]RKR07202.1 putative MATE family efflux protein [Kushneria sinocarnis]
MPRATGSPLLEGPVLKSLLGLAVPVVLANVLQSLYQLIDAFWVGRLGGHAVAAVSVCFPITFLLIALGSGLGVAGSTLVAQYMGAGQHDMVNRVAAQTLLMVALVSIGLSLLGEWLAPSLLTLLGVAPQVYDGALIFLRISLAAMIFTFGFAMFQSLMRGIGEVRTPLYIVAGTVALNVILDPLLIFGFGPLPGLGVGGAALATLITQALALLVGLWLLLRGRWTIQPTAGDFRPDWAFIRRAFRLGFPASVELSARALSMNVMVFLVSGFGTVTIAAYGVGINVLGFVIIPALGLSMATAALAGQNIGAGQVERAARIARLSALIAFVALSVVGVLVFAFATELVRFFVPTDEQVIASGGRFLRIVALTFGFMGLQMALTGVFRAAGQTLVAMVLTLISQWVLQFPLAFVLSREAVLGQSGIWWAFPVTNVVIALITMAWFARGDWMRQRLAASEEDPLAERVTEEVFAEEHR